MENQKETEGATDSANEETIKQGETTANKEAADAEEAEKKTSTTAEEDTSDTEIDPNSGASTNEEHDSATANGGTVSDLGEGEKKTEDAEDIFDRSLDKVEPKSSSEDAEENNEVGKISATSMESEANDLDSDFEDIDAEETIAEEEIEHKLASGEPPAQR